MFELLGVLIEWPLLALAPAAALLALHRWRRRRAALTAAAAWAVYAAYELAVRARLLCSGECNIRIDLLLIYPALVLLTVVALVASARGPRPAPPPPPRP